MECWHSIYKLSHVFQSLCICDTTIKIYWYWKSLLVTKETEHTFGTSVKNDYYYFIISIKRMCEIYKWALTSWWKWHCTTHRFLKYYEMSWFIWISLQHILILMLKNRNFSVINVFIAFCIMDSARKYSQAPLQSQPLFLDKKRTI